MIEKIDDLINDVQNYIAESQEDIEIFRIKYLSKKVLLPIYFRNSKILRSLKEKNLAKK